MVLHVYAMHNLLVCFYAVDQADCMLVSFRAHATIITIIVRCCIDVCRLQDNAPVSAVQPDW